MKNILCVSMDNSTYKKRNTKGELVFSRSVEVYLAECIAKKGHKITLVVNHQPFFEEGEKPENLDIIVADVNGIITEKEFENIESRDYDVAFATSVSGGKIISRIAKKKDIPSFVQILDIPEWRLSEFWKSVNMLSWEKQWNEYLTYAKDCDYIVVNTDPCLESLLKRGFDRGKIFKIYYGMDTELCDNAPFDGFAYHLSYVCRLVWYKGSDLLFLALVMLKNEGIEPRVAIIGDGPEMQRLMEFKELFNLKNVHLLGPISNEDKFKVIKASRIGVIPEFCDYIGSICPYEYICAKRPVVCWDVPIHRERVKDFPYYVPLFDIKALAEEIKRLLLTEYDQKRIDEGYAFIKSERSFDNTANELLDIFEKVKK